MNIYLSVDIDPYGYPVDNDVTSVSSRSWYLPVKFIERFTFFFPAWNSSPTRFEYQEKEEKEKNSTFRSGTNATFTNEICWTSKKISRYSLCEKVFSSRKYDENFSCWFRFNSMFSFSTRIRIEIILGLLRSCSTCYVRFSQRFWFCSWTLESIVHVRHFTNDNNTSIRCSTGWFSFHFSHVLQSEEWVSLFVIFIGKLNERTFLFDWMINFLSIVFLSNFSEKTTTQFNSCGNNARWWRENDWSTMEWWESAIFW